VDKLVRPQHRLDISVPRLQPDILQKELRAPNRHRSRIRIRTQIVYRSWERIADFDASGINELVLIFESIIKQLGVTIDFIPDSKAMQMLVSPPHGQLNVLMEPFQSAILDLNSSPNRWL
jgi:hypothetical protein